MPRYQVFATGQPAELVFGLRGGPDVRWINLKTSPVFDDQGGVRLVVNVFHDITEKRTAEKQRAENAARLRKVLDNLAAYVAVLTPDGVLVEVNRSALQIVNLKPEEMLGKRLDQTYGWDQDAETQAAVRAAITRAAAGETVRYDVSFRLPDGRPIIVDFILAPLFGADGKVEYLIPSGVDITARSELTARLAQQQRRMELILNSIPGIVFEGRGSPDKGDQKMEFISNYVEPMLGYSPEDWMNDPHFWRTIVLPEDAQTVLQQATEIYEGGAPGRLQFRCTASDGRVVHVEAYSRILKDEAGQPAGVVGVMLDVTERRQIEELIVRYAEELRQSNQELEQFAYVASHDLQEPLRMVTSYLQLVEQRYGDRLDGDAKEFIGFAIDGASRMKILINDLLTYSRVQRSQAQFEPVALEMALETALGNLQLAVEDSGAVITHDPLPQIIAHPTQMTQLLQNLLSNAIKFRGERTPQIHIGAKRERGNWHITVKDNGIGIEPEYLERIFVIFQRLHARTEYPGTGIGLAICKKIVEKHGGQIYAESTPGEGATFHLMFPMDRTNRSKRREIDTHSAGRR
jgi:PAS domain S-box-containing protein